MDAGISSVRFPKCFDVDSQARPLHRSTRKELSDSDLNNLADHYLKEGERLCYKVSERGSYEWFAYGAAAEPAGTSGFEGTFAVQFKAGLAIIFGLGSLAVILDALWRYAFESTKLPPPADEKAEGERERAEAERPTSVEVPERREIFDKEAPFVLDDRPWQKEGWFRMLGDHDKEAVRMLIEQDLPEALKSRLFRESYMDADDRLRPEGLRYLIDSREGTLLEGTDLRVGSMRLRRRDKRGARGGMEPTRRIRDIARKAVK